MRLLPAILRAMRSSASTREPRRLCASSLRLLPVEVVDGVVESVDRPQLRLSRHRCDLAAVRVLDDLRRDLGVSDDVASRFARAIDDLMRTVRAVRKVRKVARLQLALAVRRSQRRSAAQNEDELFVAVMKVVRAVRLAWKELDHAHSEPASARYEPPRVRLPALRGRVDLLPLVGEDIGHSGRSCISHRRATLKLL